MDTLGSAGTVANFNWFKFTTTAVPPPSAPASLTARAATSASQISIGWTNTTTSQTGVKVQRSTDGTNFTTITTVGATATSYTDSGLAASTKYYYRVLATGSGLLRPKQRRQRDDPERRTVADVPVVARLDHATSGWGTVQKDKSVAGKTLTLAGTTYTKGLGTHADSTITYGLGGQYTSFQSDVGVDEVARAPAQ